MSGRLRHIPRCSLVRSPAGCRLLYQSAGRPQLARAFEMCALYAQPGGGDTLNYDDTRSTTRMYVRKNKDRLVITTNTKRRSNFRIA